MHRLTVTTDDGVKLAVRHYGSLTATNTVVLLHGVCQTQQCWGIQVHDLVKRFGDNLGIVTYDHRGHGQSGSAAMATYTVAQLADDLDCVLSTLGLSRPVIAGHSMGAMTAIEHASRPRRITPHGLVLIAAAAGRIADRGLGRLLATPATGIMHQLVAHTPQRALRAAAGPFCALLARQRPAAERAQLRALSAAALATTALPTVAGFLLALRDFDAYPALSTIATPTTILSGGRDIITPPAHADDLAAGIAHARRIDVPSAGHMLPLEAPGAVLQAISDIIAANTGQHRWCDVNQLSPDWKLAGAS